MLRIIFGKFCLEKTCPPSKTKLYPYNNAKNWVDENVVAERENLKNFYWLFKNSKNGNLKDVHKNAKKAYSKILQIKTRILLEED